MRKLITGILAVVALMLMTGTANAYQEYHVGGVLCVSVDEHGIHDC